ncbi:hypothetical protein IFM89_013762 [Coptis chinensis]|uniref:Bifunctional inhibitor/plant lipid transfer protein/seed storage helical domain-containing protein n=1 Tax=Coptis chinensis TaxID=261450 RepID=A0A835LU84_9MAGN|nr:hypothetical protein IFM89_013762 [Coptis chinensis]
MALKMIEMTLTAMLVTMLIYTGAVAQSSSCTTTIISMSPCLNYITGNSSTPSSSCCSQLSSVVRSQPQCLCQVLNNGGSSLGGLNINQTLALQLPSACKVQTPPISQCNNAASPADAPAGASDTPSDSVPGNGSKTVPTTNVDSPNASSATLPSIILFFCLFIASYASA